MKASPHLALPHGKKRGPGRPRSEAADQAILRAALRIFIERGIEGATIEQVADAAGVARTTLYRRWSSKEALIAQAISAARGNPEGRTLKRVKLKRSPEPLLEALAETFTSPAYRQLAARLIGSVPNHPELMEVYWKEYLLPRRQLVCELLKRILPAGRDPEIVLDLLSGAFVHYLFIQPGARTHAGMRAYLERVLRELGLSRSSENVQRI
jgi:AcrR family transcriptional regulator